MMARCLRLEDMDMLQLQQLRQTQLVREGRGGGGRIRGGMGERIRGGGAWTCNS